MSLALIEVSAKEVRRLAIAGSSLAVGDFRLKKLIAPLEQAGAKVPVFAQVARAIGDLVNGTNAESATRLLSLSTLINAILYTQGQSSTDGGYRDLEVVATNCSSTRTGARVLKPLVQALTTTGGGRFEVVKAAVERGAFNDMRLIDPAIHALGDNFPELADLVAEKILPAYGPGIIPRIRATLELKGKKADARRLLILHQLDPSSALDLCKAALEEGTPEVKAAAISCLGKHEVCLPLVLDQAKAKNKMLRAAALEALAEHDRPEIAKLFTELIQGKALDVLARPFRVLRNRQVLSSLLSEGRRVFELILKGDVEQVVRFYEVLNCLAFRKDEQTEQFALACFEQGDRLAKLKGGKNSTVTGTDLVVRMVMLMYGIGSANTLAAILAKRDQLPPMTFGLVLRSALRSWPADRVYKEFSPLLAERKGGGKEKCEVLQRFLVEETSDDPFQFDVVKDSAASPEEVALKIVPWDDRWLDAAIKADQQYLVCVLARPRHQPALDYLLKRAQGKPSADAGSIIRGLVRCQYANVTDCFLDFVSKKAKSARYFDYELQCLFDQARHLPAADLPKLDAFASKLDEKFIERFLEAIAPLRAKAQPI